MTKDEILKEIDLRIISARENHRVAEEMGLTDTIWELEVEFLESIKAELSGEIVYFYNQDSTLSPSSTVTISGIGASNGTYADIERSTTPLKKGI